GFQQVQPIIRERCVTCHSARPTDPTFPAAPAGVMFDTPEQIQALAARIHERTVVNKTMPLGNLTNMTEQERVLLGQWFQSGAPLQ
ncbi:MAG TPA: hypothetical protein VNN09_11335, partial [Candidatus Competibacteraceae bacterium]|nr:hypothetical protein [Candidatus Competibacteraceae bacterium]